MLKKHNYTKLQVDPPYDFSKLYPSNFLIFGKANNLIKFKSCQRCNLRRSRKGFSQ